MRFQMLLEQMGRISVLATTARLLMLWAPPILYIFIFLPCWECYDFEAAAAHEVGHALGLMHPDQAVASGTNLMWSGIGDGAARAAPCDDPWSAVVAAPPDASVAPSIMLAFTQFNKGVCLSQDDLDALNTLYPLCDHRVATPQCYKTDCYKLMKLGTGPPLEGCGASARADAGEAGRDREPPVRLLFPGGVGRVQKSPSAEVLRL